jgi:hypothetical protein
MIKIKILETEPRRESQNTNITTVAQIKGSDVSQYEKYIHDDGSYFTEKLWYVHKNVVFEIEIMGSKKVYNPLRLNFLKFCEVRNILPYKESASEEFARHIEKETYEKLETEKEVKNEIRKIVAEHREIIDKLDSLWQRLRVNTHCSTMSSELILKYLDDPHTKLGG